MKEREKEDLKNFKTTQSSKLNRAFDLLEEGIKEFEKIQLTEEESAKIERFLKLLTPLKNIPQIPVE